MTSQILGALLVSFTLNVHARVINGLSAVGPNGEEYFKPVVEIGHNNCTGTMVGPNVILTAAHCILVVAKDHVIPFGPYFAVPPGFVMLNRKEVPIKGIFVMATELKIGTDLAVIWAEGEMLPKEYYTVSFEPVPVGAEVTFAGYSRVERFKPGWIHDQNITPKIGKPSGKRWGQNYVINFHPLLIAIESPLRDDGSKFLSTGKPTGKNAGVAHGDSGGPLIYNNQIVGVTDAIAVGKGVQRNLFGVATSKYDVFTALAGGEARTFLDALEFAGVPIQFSK
jgi:hypothetical protein